MADSHPVVGVWEVWADGAPFDHHVMMFNPEHTMLQSNPDGGNSESSDSIGMGVWRAEHDTVIGRFLETRADRVTRKGSGCSVIRFELHVAGNEFTGRAMTIAHDSHGTPLGDGSDATLRGRRFTE